MIGGGTIILGAGGISGGPDIVFRSSGANPSVINSVYKMKDNSGSLVKGLRFNTAWINSTPGSYNSTITASALGTSIFFVNATTTSSTINFLGNVGIGTTSPGYKLDVQGGDINASGSVRAAGVALTSDIRYKRNIASIKNSLDKILNLRGVTYDWRRDEFPERHFSDRRQLGVIAQEVEKEFPEAVDTDKDGYKSVAYTMLISPVIEAVKTLYNHQSTQDREIASVKAENTQLRTRAENTDNENAQLKKENAEIKARLERIEKALNSK